MLLGAVEVVAAVCFASNLYIGQGVAVGYKAEAADASDKVAIKTNAKRTYVAFFTVVNLLVLNSCIFMIRYTSLVVF